MNNSTMPPIDEEQARIAFQDHLVQKATNARLSYGLYIDTETILRMLDDTAIMRHRVSISFDAGPLQAGEFAFAQPLGFQPSDGFCLSIHPWFENQAEILPLLIAYHMPVINYGDIVGRAEAETFGATLLGMEVDAYYQALCELADSIPKE